ncbi:MAG: hypothetical protein KJ023_00245 [Burkholderiaceae bacterium]|jgi:hypothetical protein|nr:hypothetical protein [Burkholderiaceae bacterium]
MSCTPPRAAGPGAQRERERAELRRIASLAVIRRAAWGGRVDAAVLAEARAFVAATPPLGRPLGTGEPA